MFGCSAREARTRKRVLELRRPVTVPQDIRSLGRMNDDRPDLEVFQQGRDLVFGDWKVFIGIYGCLQHFAAFASLGWAGLERRAAVDATHRSGAATTPLRSRFFRRLTPRPALLTWLLGRFACFIEAVTLQYR